MSNLGWYQIMTTLSKRVGGPINLAGIVFGGGSLFGGGAVAGGLLIKNKVSQKLKQKELEEKASIIYTVEREGQSNEGLLFKENEQFKVLEADGNATLIEKLGDNNNPYFVSTKFLRSISDYR